MTRLLIISHEHALLPFAFRAKKQGMEVEVLIGNPRYRAAWEGRLPKLDLPASLAEQQDAVRALIAEQDVTVLTDSRQWTAALGGYPRVHGVGPSEPTEHGPVELAVGGWWTGDGWSRHHVLLVERGLWTGGGGPLLPGAILAVQPAEWPTAWEEALQRLEDRLKAASFLGLVQATIRLTPGGGWEHVGFEAGWSLFHAHAVLAGEDDSVAELLAGSEEIRVAGRFAAVLPVSVPPWPHRAHAKEHPRPVELPRELTRWVFFHDIVVEGVGLRTAGLGGLVGAARGVGRTAAGALLRAHAVAAQLQVAERQYRSDGGQQVAQAWTGLVEAGLVEG